MVGRIVLNRSSMKSTNKMPSPSRFSICSFSHFHSNWLQRNKCRFSRKDFPWSSRPPSSGTPIRQAVWVCYHSFPVSSSHFFLPQRYSITLFFGIKYFLPILTDSISPPRRSWYAVVFPIPPSILCNLLRGNHVRIIGKHVPYHPLPVEILHFSSPKSWQIFCFNNNNIFIRVIYYL